MSITRRAFVRNTSLAAALAWSQRSLLAGQTPDFQPLATLIDEQVTSGVVPGAGVIVGREGKTIFSHQVGTYCSHAKMDEPYDTSVAVPLFSYSKFVSATVVAMLVQDGLLDYDQPIASHIPEFANKGKEKITLAHLLTHSAGIPAVPIAGVGTPEKWDIAVKTICEAPLAFEPGSACVYHGLTAMLVAAEAARRVTGKPWQAICKERLFDPIGAATMTFELPRPPAKLALIPQPAKDLHFLVAGKYGSTYEPLLLGQPAGGCFASLPDAIKVVQLHLNGGTWNGKALLKPEVLQRVHTVHYRKEIDAAIKAGRPATHQSWGLGPMLRGPFPADGVHSVFGFHNQPSPTIFGHAGLNSFIGTGIPDLNLALVFTTTNSATEQATYDLRNRVTDAAVAAVR